MRNIISLSIAIFFLLITNSCYKQEETIYDRQDKACQECYDLHPLIVEEDTGNIFIKGILNSTPFQYSTKSNKNSAFCVSSGMGYTPVNQNGTIAIDFADAFGQSVVIGIAPVNEKGKEVYNRPRFTIGLPFIKYNKDSVKTFEYVLDKFLKLGDLPLQKNREIKTIYTGFEFSVQLFCIKDDANINDFQSNWRLTSNHEKQSSKAHLKLTNILKEEHVLSYEYTLRFEIECKLFKNNEYVGWLRDGVYKTNFHVSK
jgi:hypothetical protein